MGSHYFQYFKLTISFALVMASLGCSTTETKVYYMPEDAAENSQANVHSYGSDSMAIRKAMPNRESPPMDFYYKHCSSNGDSSYFSKTAYDCTGPY